ncbi:DUF2550 domain-containing protein [Williamsia deligens]|uniref:DUF2550 domain-containing protein n=1 Tax=Williamsia deligens TaxID=321325 RepID=A0ABW3GAQ9_9NOCA|nr:DUF2550 domain-containing protein [Williamsia deligens]MCP2196278.1 Protein of unknown function (DUF2550) [Williamsia deligens]
MSTTTALVLVVVAVFVVGVLALAVGVGVRVGRLRRRGTAVLFRVLPAGEDRGWRHGIVRYNDDALVYYRLSSLRTGPSRVIERQAIEILGRRSAHGTEVDVIEDMTVVEIEAGNHRYELAMYPGAVTAFQSWVESRPSVRSRRRRSA